MAKAREMVRESSTCVIYTCLSWNEELGRLTYDRAKSGLYRNGSTSKAMLLIGIPGTLTSLQKSYHVEKRS